MKSSLTFQIFLYLGSWYWGAFCLIEVLLNVFKYIVFPNTFGNFFANFAILILTGLLETVRIFAGWKGNLTENLSLIVTSLVMIIPGILGVVYLMLWQIYVLRLEIILCSVQLTIQGIQLIFTIICLFTFYGSNY